MRSVVRPEKHPQEPAAVVQKSLQASCLARLKEQSFHSAAVKQDFGQTRVFFPTADRSNSMCWNATCPLDVEQLLCCTDSAWSRPYFAFHKTWLLLRVARARTAPHTPQAGEGGNPEPNAPKTLNPDPETHNVRAGLVIESY